MRTARYWVVPPKSTVGCRLREKKGRRRRGEEYLVPSSPAHRRRPRVACEPSLPAGDFSPTRGERSRR
ncbi:hypothetical protein BHM03_00031338, partial [Ensete ventricosum]